MFCLPLPPTPPCKEFVFWGACFYTAGALGYTWKPIKFLGGGCNVDRKLPTPTCKAGKGDIICLALILQDRTTMHKKQVTRSA